MANPILVADNELPSTVDGITSSIIPDLVGDDVDDDLPAPLDLSGTAINRSPSLVSQISVARATRGPLATPSMLASTSAAFANTSLASVNRPTTGRRAFPNQHQNDASPSVPTPMATPKVKTLLATAFESSNAEKYGYLKQHMTWEKEKEHNLLQWEKERYTKELERVNEGVQGQLKLAEARMKAARELFDQGKTVAEVEGLLKVIFG